MAPTTPTPEPLRLYGRRRTGPGSSGRGSRRSFVDAGTYWVVAASASHPHPRPVWGIWTGDAVVLSIGSPVLAVGVDANPACTVHLDSGTDVVVLEGVAQRITEPDAALVAAYDEKYDWQYSYDEYGPFTRVAPTVVMAWRSAGWAGRDGFQTVGRWRFAVNGAAAGGQRQRIPSGGTRNEIR